MKGKKIISQLGAVSLLVFSILVSVFTVVNIKSFYIKEYAKNNVEQATGMNRRDLEKTTQLFLDYLNDKRDDLSLIVTKNGVKEQVFYERETLHMIDVKALYQNAQRAMYLLGGVSLGCYAFLFLKKQDKREFWQNAKAGYKFSLVLFLLIAIVLGIMFAVDFNRFWIGFHHVFFHNDLWLLDPAESTMINMLPEELFFSMCSKILMLFVALFGLLPRCVYLLANKFNNTK